MPDKGYAFARAMCNAVSACWEAAKFDPPPKPLKPFSKDSQANRKMLETLLKTDPDKFDSMTDEEMDMYAETVKADGGVTWM